MNLERHFLSYIHGNLYVEIKYISKIMLLVTRGSNNNVYA